MDSELTWTYQTKGIKFIWNFRFLFISRNSSLMCSVKLSMRPRLVLYRLESMLTIVVRSHSLAMSGSKEIRMTYLVHIDGLVHERRNSSALAMALRLSCNNPSICGLKTAFHLKISLAKTDLRTSNKICKAQELPCRTCEELYLIINTFWLSGN